MAVAQSVLTINRTDAEQMATDVIEAQIARYPVAYGRMDSKKMKQIHSSIADRLVGIEIRIDFTRPSDSVPAPRYTPPHSQKGMLINTRGKDPD